MSRSVLECGSLLPLFPANGLVRPAESARGLAQSKTSRRAVAFCLLTSAFCLCASGQDYTNRWSKVGGGGGTLTGGVYTATGIAGQLDAGNMSGGNYTANNGFWGIIAVQTPGAPPLVIRRGGGNNVLVCWPYPATDYGLQQCTNLTTANWTATTNERVRVGGEWQVTVSPPVGRRYYRLQKP